MLDQLATSIVSSCCKMHDVMSKGITCKSRDYHMRAAGKVIKMLIVLILHADKSHCYSITLSNGLTSHTVTLITLLLYISTINTGIQYIIIMCHTLGLC